MNRRHFLQAGLGLSSAVFLDALPTRLFSAAAERDAKKPTAYKPGDTISPDAFVVDRALNRKTIWSLCHDNDEAAVNMLYIFGGGALGRDDKLGGLWCGDSFEDLQIMRFVKDKYEFSGLQIIPVACAPVYSSQYYGLDERVFLDQPDDSDKFQRAARRFIESTEKLVEAGFIPVSPYYDLRLRLLFNTDEELKPGAGYGEIYAWQSKFRADDETQKYGVPTLWLLDSKGVILEKPFHGNVYHSDPFEINYTVVDVDRALQKYL
ncbi:MAG: hypothetical protein ACE5IY_21635 [bacterium]